MWGLIDTANRAALALIDRHTKLTARVAALEAHLGIIPAPPTPPADPVAPGPASPGGPVDGAALIAQRQARAAARRAAGEQQSGAGE
jgi:hypothetical protein